MKKGTIICFLAIILIGASCNQPNGKPMDNQEQRSDMSISDCTILSPSHYYQEHIMRMHQIGQKAVYENDTVVYKKVMNHYFLSQYPSRGLAISFLMASKNQYGKAYFDTFELLALISAGDSTVLSNNYYLLEKAKSLNYRFKDLQIGNRSIKYESVNSN